MSKRILLLIALGLLLAQATVVASLMPCHVCSSESSDDDCSPGCETCVCCTMARVAVPQPLDVCALTPVGSVIPSPITPQHPAESQDIFHVPKLLRS